MTIKKTALQATVAAAALTVAAPAAAEVKLGALMPMTGDLQVFGESNLNAVRLAAQDVNGAGGVHGESVEVVVGDTQTRPQAGVDAAQRLVNVESVDAIVGALSSGVTVPVARSVTIENGVPQVSPASTTPVLTGMEDDDWVFRTTPTDAFQGRKLAELTSEKGVENVGIVYVNNDYGQGLNDAFTENFENMGGTVSASVAYEQGQSSYRGEIQRAAREGADAMVLIGYPEYGNVIIRQAIEGGYFQDFVFTDGMRSDSVVNTIGADVLEGSFGTAPASLDNPASQYFEEAYQDEYGSSPEQFAANGYDAAFVLALAAEAADEVSREAIRDNLRNVANPPGEEILPGEFGKAQELLANGEDIDYAGAAGPQDFDAEGDVPGFIRHWEFQDGAVADIRIMD